MLMFNSSCYPTVIPSLYAQIRWFIWRVYICTSSPRTFRLFADSWHHHSDVSLIINISTFWIHRVILSWNWNQFDLNKPMSMDYSNRPFSSLHQSSWKTPISFSINMKISIIYWVKTQELIQYWYFKNLKKVYHAKLKDWPKQLVIKIK